MVLCILGASHGDETLFELLVTGIGGATEHVVTEAIEHILRNASEITELKVDGLEERRHLFAACR